MQKCFWLVAAAFMMMFLAACDNGKTKIPYTEVQTLTGDPVRGEELFHTSIERMPTCESCHKPEDSGSPSLIGYSTRADKRVEGLPAHEYTFYSIAEPGRHVVQDYGNAMYNQYDNKLSPQDIADLMAYVLSL